MKDFILILFAFIIMGIVIDHFQKKPDYTIELDNQHGVIINSDTIQLEELEEYIIQDNL